MDRKRVRELALAAGFQLKGELDGEADLKPCVYEFAEALLAEQDQEAWVSVDDWPKGCPDDDRPLGSEEFLPLILHWDDGEVEQGHYHYVGMDQPRFQRQCGTDEGGTGWKGDVGRVLHWRHMPKAPEVKQI